MTECREFLVEVTVLLTILKIYKLLDRILLEECQTTVKTDLLTSVDKWLALWQYECKSREGLVCITHTLELGTCPRVLVVVRGKHKTHCWSRILLIVTLKVLLKILNILSISLDSTVTCYVLSLATTLCHSVEDVVKLPSVCSIETALVQPSLLTLSQEVNIRVNLANLLPCLSPEITRYVHRNITTVAIDTLLYPELKSIDHSETHLLILIVKLCDICPVVLYDRKTLLPIHNIPLLLTLVPPVSITRCVVSNPVDDNLQTEVVCCVKEAIEVLHSTELRVNSLVVDN